MKQFEIKTKTLITPQMITDLFSCAMYGSSYWACELIPEGSGGPCLEDNMIKGFSIGDGETGKVHKISKARIKKAVQLLATQQPVHFWDWIQQNEDATTGDVFLQLCVFGEVIYG